MYFSGWVSIRLIKKLVRNLLYDRLCTTLNCVIYPNGRDGDCMSSDTVYLISCKACGDEYIGEKGRPLCPFERWCLDGKIKTKQSTPLETHRAQRQNGENFEVGVRVLAQERKTSARKILEAF